MECPKKKSIRRSNKIALEAITKARVSLRDIDLFNIAQIGNEELEAIIDGIVEQIVIAEGNLKAQETVISIL